MKTECSLMRSLPRYTDQCRSYAAIMQFIPNFGHFNNGVGLNITTFLQLKERKCLLNSTNMVDFKIKKKYEPSGKVLHVCSGQISVSMD